MRFSGFLLLVRPDLKSFSLIFTQNLLREDGTGMKYSPNAIWWCGAFAAMLAGCKSPDDFVQERAEFANSYFQRINQLSPEENKVYSLPECIAAALSANLDLKVSQLNERVAREKATAEALGMLPDLYISNSTTNRFEEPGSTSINVKTDEESLVASRSSEEFENNLRFELALSVLDFGLACVNYAQAEDRLLLTEYQTRRQAQNLTLEVVQTYYKVAAAQKAIEETTELLERCRNIQQDLSTLGKENRISPFRMFDESQRFIGLEKRLVAYMRSYENNCTHLRALMGYKPSAMIRVDTSNLSDLKPVELPKISDLELYSLYNRPELYQLDINTDILAFDRRKAILMMLPNVRMFADFNNSSNPLLYKQSWWEIGVRAAYNLLKLPQQVARYRAIQQEEESMKAQVMALSVGIMAQVQIAVANISEAEERYEIAKRTYETYQSYAEYAQNTVQATGGISTVELDRIKLETAEAKIDCQIELANYYVAYYRLLNVLGVEELSNQTMEQMNADLQNALIRLMEKGDFDVNMPAGQELIAAAGGKMDTPAEVPTAEITVAEVAAAPAEEAVAEVAAVPAEEAVAEVAAAPSTHPMVFTGRIMKLASDVEGISYVAVSLFEGKSRVICALRGDNNAFEAMLNHDFVFLGDAEQNNKLNVPIMNVHNMSPAPATTLATSHIFDKQNQVNVSGNLVALAHNNSNLRYALREKSGKVVCYLAGVDEVVKPYVGKEVRVEGISGQVDGWSAPVVGVASLCDL